MGYLDLADRSWPLLHRVMGLHTVAYRATRGVVGQKLPGLPQMLLLDHVGARSGTRRTSPLIYLADGRDLVIVASKGGFGAHPAWLHNLRANPDTRVQVGSQILPVHARVATADERRRLWPLLVDLYPDYDTYQRRTDREIPVVVLEPRRP